MDYEKHQKIYVFLSCFVNDDCVFSKYTVYAGSYGVKNQTVTKLAEFKTTISADKTSVEVGTTVNLTGKVYNENGHRYNSHYFTVKNLDTNSGETRHYAQSEGDYVY